MILFQNWFFYLQQKKRNVSVAVCAHFIFKWILQTYLLKFSYTTEVKQKLPRFPVQKFVMAEKGTPKTNQFLYLEFFAVSFLFGEFGLNFIVGSFHSTRHLLLRELILRGNCFKRICSWKWDTNKEKTFCKTLDHNFQRASLAKITPKRHDKFKSWKKMWYR